MAGLVFDYDGTLHDSMATYAPAFRETMHWLEDLGYLEKKDYADSEISCWLGYASAEMWQQFQPDLPLPIREQARIRLGNEMARRIDNGEGRLFPHTEEVLAELKAQGHQLCFLSNCRYQYLERHRRVFGLDRFFDRFYCCEQFDFQPKHQILSIIAPEIRQPVIVIGDRFHDMEMALRNNFPFIGCSYGYGTAEELSHADLCIQNLKELPDAVQQLTNKLS